MLDYDWVTSRLAVGGQIADEQDRIAELIEIGITHVVNLQSEEEGDDTEIFQGTSVRYRVRQTVRAELALRQPAHQ